MANKGHLVFLLLDISNSMLAEDVKPNRLSLMKKEMTELIELSSGDQFALGVFARSSVMAVPFTSDLSVVKAYLDDVSPEFLSSQGTHFLRAFKMASRSFEKVAGNIERGQKKEDLLFKTVVLVSDGEEPSPESKDVIEKDD